MNDPLLERIQREAGIAELIDVLVERLAPTDLQSLLLEVYRRRATSVLPSQLLERYERDRFVRPSPVTPDVLANLDRLVWSVLPDHYAAIELSPVCPLGTNASVATVDQNKVVTTIRNNEVVADATNVLPADVFFCVATHRTGNGCAFAPHTAWYAHRRIEPLQACFLIFVSLGSVPPVLRNGSTTRISSG